MQTATNNNAALDQIVNRFISTLLFTHLDFNTGFQ
jgi:hypothetical protein